MSDESIEVRLAALEGRLGKPVIQCALSKHLWKCIDQTGRRMGKVTRVDLACTECGTRAYLHINQGTPDWDMWNLSISWPDA